MKPLGASACHYYRLKFPNLNYFKGQYSLLLQYKILEKLVTYIVGATKHHQHRTRAYIQTCVEDFVSWVTLVCVTHARNQFSSHIFNAPEVILGM